MIYENDFQKLKKDFNEAQRKKRKINTIIFLVLALMMVGMSIAIYFAVQNDTGFASQTGIMIYFLVWFIFFALFIGLAYVMSKFVYEKPFVNIVYDKIIDQINVDEGQTYTYQAYEKNNKEQIERFYQTGLFPRSAAFVKFHINGFNQDQKRFDLYDVRLVQSNGQSTTILFDGLFRVLNVEYDTTLQVRTQGKPYLKGTKFRKVDVDNEFLVFKPEGQSANEIDQKLIAVIKSIYDRTTMKHIYLSVNNHQLALAIKHRKHPLVKPKKFDMAVVNQYMEKIQKEIELTDIL